MSGYEILGASVTVKEPRYAIVLRLKNLPTVARREVEKEYGKGMADIASQFAALIPDTAESVLYEQVIDKIGEELRKQGVVADAHLTRVSSLKGLIPPASVDLRSALVGAASVFGIGLLWTLAKSVGIAAALVLIVVYSASRKKGFEK